MGLDMYMSSVPKVKSVAELRKIEIRLAEAYFAGELETELNKIKDEKEFIWDMPITIEKYPETKAKYEEYKKADGHVIKIDVGIRVGYWRKFNALHAWFVENVQKGEDNCGQYIVKEEKLLKLQKDLMELTPENVAKKLPTQEGFFFGAVDYDEYYWQDVEQTKALVSYLLCQINHNERTLIYQSSW